MQKEKIRYRKPVFRLRYQTVFDRIFHALRVMLNRVLISVEKKGDAPDTRKSNYYVNYSRKYRACASANPRHKVKGKQPNQAPVKRSDNNESKGNFVNKHIQFMKFPFFVRLISISEKYDYAQGYFCT